MAEIAGPADCTRHCTQHPTILRYFPGLPGYVPSEEHRRTQGSGPLKPDDPVSCYAYRRDNPGLLSGLSRLTDAGFSMPSSADLFLDRSRGRRSP
jgi:hypothetical protein